MKLLEKMQENQNLLSEMKRLPTKERMDELISIIENEDVSNEDVKNFMKNFSEELIAIKTANKKVVYTGVDETKYSVSDEATRIFENIDGE